MPTAAEAVQRVRTLANDASNYPDGQPKPDIAFSDGEIVIELKRAMLQLLISNPKAYYPNAFSASIEIVAMSIGDNLPVSAQYLPEVEMRAFQTLSIRDQEGARPEVALQPNVLQQ